VYAINSGVKARCLRKWASMGKEWMKKMKVILWMNALLEPMLLNPRKAMNSWQPNPITSLESPLDSFLCVHYYMIWHEMQRLGLVLVVYDGIILNTWVWVKQWLWGFGWWSFLDVYHAYELISAVTLILVLLSLKSCMLVRIDWFKHSMVFSSYGWCPWWIKHHFLLIGHCLCHLRTSELFFLCLRTSKTVNLGEFVSRFIRLTFV